jgi:hypothetical protein
MVSLLNMVDDGIEPHFWEMVAFITAQIDDAEAILWCRDGRVHFLKHYPDGTEAIIQWQFDPADFKNYLERSTQIQRALFIQTIGALVKNNTNTVEKLDSLPASLRLLGYLPKRIR